MDLSRIARLLAAAKTLLTDTVPDGLRGAANVTKRVHEALDLAATEIEKLGDAIPAFADANQARALDELHEIQEECERLSHRRKPAGTTEDGTPVGLDPVLAAILAKLIAASAERLLERLKQRRERKPAAEETGEHPAASE